jgi:hypothetical protein
MVCPIARMNIHDFDWRIEPLHDVIVGIEGGLKSIRERLDDEEGVDGLSALERAEPLLGLGFVAFQIYAVGTWTDLNSIRKSRGKRPVSKWDCYKCDPIKVKGDTTRIELINASANYFKHHDEWLRWPTENDLGVPDTEILGRVGITQKTEFPCVEAVNLLCGSSWKLIVLHQIVKEWRAHVINKTKSGSC